jgi:hypothetical protein
VVRKDELVGEVHMIEFGGSCHVVLKSVIINDQHHSVWFLRYDRIDFGVVWMKR